MSIEQLQEAYDILCKHETSEDIAGFFRALGVQGYQGHASGCAVSEYMMMNGAKHVSTGPNSGTYVTDISPNPTVYAEYERLSIQDHPVPIRQFIKNFDKGHYPDLIRRD